MAEKDSSGFAEQENSFHYPDGQIDRVGPGGVCDDTDPWGDDATVVNPERRKTAIRILIVLAILLLIGLTIPQIKFD